MTKLAAATVIAATLLCPLQARAAISRSDIFHGSAGALFTLGGDLWTEPDHPSWFAMDGVPFGDTAGGLGVGGGFFFQARFVKWIGLEIGFLFEHDHQWYDIEYNGGAANLRYHIRYALVRIPILVQVVFNTPSMRIALGFGPEFAVSRNNRDDVTVESGAVPDVESIKRLFDTRTQNDVMICAAIGFSFKVWRFSIPFDIRYSYNATQPKGYEQRLGLTTATTGITASQSMDLRLMTGLAYDF